MEKIKSYAETISIILSVFITVLTAVIWMNGRFNEIENRFGQVEKDLAIVKTVLIMKNIMPTELAKAKE